MDKETSAKQKKLVLGIIIAVFLLYINFGLILAGQLKNLKNISTRLKQAGSSLSQYTKYSDNLKELSADINSLKGKYAARETMIFSDSDMPLFLNDISQKANALGIKMMQIRPEAVDEKAKGSPVYEVAGFKFWPLAIKLELSCGYHQLGVFLSRLESNPLVAVTDLKIIRDSLDSRKQKSELTLRIYVNKK